MENRREIARQRRATVDQYLARGIPRSEIAKLTGIPRRSVDRIAANSSNGINWYNEYKRLEKELSEAIKARNELNDLIKDYDRVIRNNTELDQQLIQAKKSIKELSTRIFDLEGNYTSSFEGYKKQLEGVSSAKKDTERKIATLHACLNKAVAEFQNNKLYHEAPIPPDMAPEGCLQKMNNLCYSAFLLEKQRKQAVDEVARLGVENAQLSNKLTSSQNKVKQLSQAAVVLKKKKKYLLVLSGTLTFVVIILCFV